MELYDKDLLDFNTNYSQDENSIVSTIRLGWLKIGWSLPLSFFFIYSSLSIWFKLPHYVVQPAPLCKRKRKRVSL